MCVFEVLIVLFLIALNGLFSMSELAVVSARRTRMRALAGKGAWGARSALALAAEPGHFLSTVQIGITMIGVIAGAFSGATLGGKLTAWFVELGVGLVAAEWLGFGLVITAVTFLSIIFGELVPKQLALVQPERIACQVAPGMTLLAAIAWPAAWVLQVTTQTVFALLGFKTKSDDSVSQDEVRAMIAEAEQSGAIEASEKHMIAGVLRLGSRPVTGVMTPRTDVQWIDLTMGESELATLLAGISHSRLPACEGSIDAIAGVIQVRELLADLMAGRKLDLRAHLRQATVIPSTSDALDVLAKLRSADVPMALVHNEYGDFEGLVTPADLLETIAGSFRSHDDGEAEPHATERADGSWLLSGAMPADEMAEHLGFVLDSGRDYQTLAGFALGQLKRLPAVGETFEAFGWQFEIVDLDGRRIDKVIASRAPVRRAAKR
ncbi:MAG: hemolysin family protein [Alphaproteobacteria bacterium]|nr:hemolysin family protein [Alphaproteobacteria bacterium]